MGVVQPVLEERARLRDQRAEMHAKAAAEADAHRAAMRVAREYCNNLTATVMTPSAYDYATQARALAELFMDAEVGADLLRIARDLARHLVMAAFLADHLERAIPFGGSDGPS